MTILITGGAGFIGSNLVQSLVLSVDSKTEILVLDNFSTGSRANLRNILPPEMVLEGDVTDPDCVLGLSTLSITQIYHLASPASPKAYQRDSLATIHTNYQGTRNVLELARRTGARVLLASTSEIYGEPLEHPQKEEYRGNVNTMGPRACYDEGKRIAETLMYEYHRNFGIQIRVARIFNTYGPGLNPDDGRVVSNFIRQALQGAPLTIYGDGSQTRSLCYVDDLIRGLTALMKLSAMTSPEVLEPINLGNPMETSILTLAQQVYECVHYQLDGLETNYSKPEILHLPLPKDDPSRRLPDIQRADYLLNWQPKVTLVEGLRLTIRSFREDLTD